MLFRLKFFTVAKGKTIDMKTPLEQVVLLQASRERFNNRTCFSRMNGWLPNQRLTCRKERDRSLPKENGFQYGGGAKTGVCAVSGLSLI